MTVPEFFFPQLTRPWLRWPHRIRVWKLVQSRYNLPENKKINQLNILVISQDKRYSYGLPATKNRFWKLWTLDRQNMLVWSRKTESGGSSFIYVQGRQTHPIIGTFYNTFYAIQKSAIWKQKSFKVIENYCNTETDNFYAMYLKYQKKKMQRA
jgi:hypothetical protein